MDAVGRTHGAIEELERARERQVRMLGAEHRARRALGALAEDHGGRPGRAQEGRVFPVGEEGEVAGAGVLDPGNAMNLGVAVSVDAALEARSNVPQLQARSIRRRARGTRGAGRATNLAL